MSHGISAAALCLVLVPAALHAQRDTTRRDTVTDCPMDVSQQPQKVADRMPVVKPRETDSAAPAPMPTARVPCPNPKAPPVRPPRDSIIAPPPRESTPGGAPR